MSAPMSLLGLKSAPTTHRRLITEQPRLTRSQTTGLRLESAKATRHSTLRRACEVLRWNEGADGAVSESAIREKAARLGFRDFSDLLCSKAPVGSRFPFHAHGDVSLECQVVGSSRFYFLDQEPVDIYPGDIVNCPKGKDGAHSVESLTDDITFLVANKEVVFDDMVIALFNNQGLGKANYAETINGAILEERIQAAGALTCS